MHRLVPITAAFKNIYDWVSRVEKSIWSQKPMFLLATSPGKRGGMTVLKQAVNDFPHRGANVVANFSLPSFKINFSKEGIKDDTLRKEFEVALSTFKQNLEVVTLE